MNTNNTTLVNQLTADYVMMVAKEINAQIRATASTNVIWSWGLSKRVATTYKDMPALALRVSGVIHKGWVYICLNEARDVYEVYCVSVRGKEKNVNKEVYCDNIGWVLDSMIERGFGMNDETYSKKAFADTYKKTGLRII